MSSKVTNVERFWTTVDRDYSNLVKISRNGYFKDAICAQGYGNTVRRDYPNRFVRIIAISKKSNHHLFGRCLFEPALIRSYVTPQNETQPLSALKVLLREKGNPSRTRPGVRSGFTAKINNLNAVAASILLWSTLDRSPTIIFFDLPLLNRTEGSERRRSAALSSDIAASIATRCNVRHLYFGLLRASARRCRASRSASSSLMASSDVVTSESSALA